MLLVFQYKKSGEVASGPPFLFLFFFFFRAVATIFDVTYEVRWSSLSQGLEVPDPTFRYFCEVSLFFFLMAF